jgi:hypothetical protein
LAQRVHGDAEDMTWNIRTADVVVAVWTVVWVVAAVVVFLSVWRLDQFGQTVATASRGLTQTSRGLERASAGLRDTGEALDLVPVVGGSIGDDIRATAKDLDEVAGTVRRLSQQSRRNAAETTRSAHTLAFVLGAAVLLMPTVPIVVLYLILRPLVAQQLARR